MVMQFYIIPMITGMAGTITLSGGGLSTTGDSSTGTEALDASQAFLYLMIIQGVFSGLTIGKLSDGRLRAGLKHSFALVALAFLISTAASILFG
jgi:hypothetical protein